MRKMENKEKRLEKNWKINCCRLILFLIHLSCDFMHCSFAPLHNPFVKNSTLNSVYSQCTLELKKIINTYYKLSDKSDINMFLVAVTGK